MNFPSRPRPYILSASILLALPLALVLAQQPASTPASPAPGVVLGSGPTVPAVAPTAAKPVATPPVVPDLPALVEPEHFTVPEGMELTVWATTPMLRNPTNIDFDQDGRLYVAEGVDYRSHSGRDKAGDRITVLEDSDGDGKADKTSTFVQDEKLAAPLGVAVFDNKVIVSQPPDMLVYTDVNRDGKIDGKDDKREVLLTGFNGRQHDHSLHSVTAGPDGQLYWNQGNTGALFKDKGGRTFRMGSPYLAGKGPAPVVDPGTIAGQPSDDGHVYIGGFTARMNEDGSDVKIVAHNYRNSFEQAVNSLGDIYQSDNDDPPACRVTPLLEGGNAGFASADGKRSWQADRRPGQSVPVAEWRQEDPGTMPAGDVYGGGSPTGVLFYENGALGEKWQGLLLACEAGRNVIFGYFPKPNGAGFKMERFDFLTSNKEGKFAGSDFLGGTTSVTSEVKTLFRPSDVAVGPDGALYIADWFDPRVGGHSDLDNKTLGTIYRLAPKGFKSVVPKIDLASTEGQVLALKSPAINVRYLGFAKLKAQGEPAVPAVAALLQDKNPYIAARAIWLLAQMGPKGVAQVMPLLDSKDEQVRLVAFRALRQAQQEMPALAKRLVNDKSAAVRREVAAAIRDWPFEQKQELLLALAKQFDGQDRAYLEAWGLSCEGKEREMYAALFGNTLPMKWTPAQAWLAWRLHPTTAVSALTTRAASGELSPELGKLTVDSLAFVKSPYAALAMVDLASAPNFPQKEQAMWWLFNRKGNLWNDYGVEDAMIEKGLYDPANVTLSSVVSPEPPAEPTKLPAPAEIAQLKGDAKRGQAMTAACQACHRIGSQGAEFGPDLTVFGKTQGREVIINAIINPSADIAHGFEGSRVTTKDGLTIDGLVLSKGDPVIIRSMGGVNQTVPAKRVKSVTPLGRSLMLSADMMGLDAQALADVTAYLQSDIK